MTNYGKFKIIDQPQLPSNFIKFTLDGYVTYKDGAYNKIYFVNRHPFDTYRVGDYLEIDLDRTTSFSSGSDVNDTRIARSYGEVEERNNVSVNRASETIIQVLNKAIDSDERNRYTASLEVNPKTGNITYHLSGERK